jgi:hypothetical protein
MGDKGAVFLTEPLKNPDGWEWRCYVRDPGYLIEVGQYTEVALDTKVQLSYSARLWLNGCRSRCTLIGLKTLFCEGEQPCLNL